MRALLVLITLSGVARATTYTVDSTTDSDDADATDGACDIGNGRCTLRAAITQANHDANPDTIQFAIVSPSPIPVASPLPTITQPLTIDGSSQSGFTGTPLIELDGGDNSHAGLVINSAGATTISSLSLHGFTTAIDIQGGTSTFLAGNYIGLDTTGSSGSGNTTGVHVGTAGVIIGSSDPADRNVISKNGTGVLVDSAAGATIRGNYFGTDAGGTGGFANTTGISLVSSSNNLVDKCLITGNVTGIAVSGGSGNTFSGNTIGLSATGSAAHGNVIGISLTGSTQNGEIGGTTATARNVITANSIGINIGSATSMFTIEGNYIGTNVAGTSGIGQTNGILINGGAHDNLIGGSSAASRNVISGNTEGIDINGAGSNNKILGNYIGTTAAGTAAAANASGVVVTSGTALIGDVGAGNVISGNGTGIRLNGGSSSVTVLGNYIGTDATGTAALGNSGNGMIVQGGNHIIGNTSGGMNLISGNGSAGISFNSGGGGTVVSGNYIGTDITGGIALANADGVVITSVSGIQVSSNLISGNTGNGVRLTGGSSTPANSNTINGNVIGANAAGTLALGNSVGVLISRGNNNTIGGTGSNANIIAFNNNEGILAVIGTGNRFQQNSIFGNGTLGIDLSSSATADGVTMNDALDADTGPNNFQNFPTLSAAVVNGGHIFVAGSVASQVSSDYTVELFSSASCDADGFGEGAQYLGSIDVATDDTGAVPFLLGVPSPSPAGQSITATAYGSDGTSEFSACITSTGCGALQVSPTPLPSAIAGQPYNQQLSGSGGIGGYSFAVTSASPPPGITVSGSALAGTPTASGNFAFTITTTDSAGCESTANLSIGVSCPSIVVSPAPLPDGMSGTAYNQTLTAMGGTAPYAFTVSSGSLPDGVTLGADGTLSGDPAAGAFTFSVTATDNNGCTGSQSYTVTISAGPDLSQLPDLSQVPDLSPLPDLASGNDLTAAPDLSSVPVLSGGGGCGCDVGGSDRGGWLALVLVAFILGIRRVRKTDALS